MLRFRRMSWSDSVVPFRMEEVSCDVKRLHLGIGDLDALLVIARIERAFDLEAGFGCRCGDGFDHGKTTCERPGAPSLGYVTEQAMFDFIPLRCARRIVMNVDCKARFICKVLKFAFPEAHTRTIRAATVGGDCQIL